MKGRERPRNMFLQWRKMCVFSRRNRKRRTDRLSITNQTSAGHFFFPEFLRCGKRFLQTVERYKNEENRFCGAEWRPGSVIWCIFLCPNNKKKKKSHKLRPLSLDGTQNCFLNEKNINILRVRGREESAGRPFSPSSVQDIRFTPLAPFWTLGNPVLVFPKRSRQSPFGE